LHDLAAAIGDRRPRRVAARGDNLHPPLEIVVLLALPETVSLPPALITVPLALPPDCTI
jgi:hypothetical protein